MPAKKIVDLAKSKNIPVLIDGTQGAPHSVLDVQDLECDFYAISCHKMYGPNGLGILYAKKKWVDELPPYQGGRGMISEVKKDNITYADSPTKFEAGTMQTAEVVAFAKSIKFIQDLGIKNIEKHESQILEYGLEKLRKDNSINIIGNPKNRASIISFTIKGIHPHDIATILDDDGVAIRAGHHCCQILHDKLGIPASARASIGVYNSKEDIDVLSESINKCESISDLNGAKELYQEIILDHAKNPRNKGKCEGYNHDAKAHNPLCGDKVHIYLKLDKDKNISGLSFEGEGCAISLASASILTDTLKGRDLQFSKKVTDDFLSMLKNKSKITLNSLTENQITTISSLSGVQEFPMRIKCATMAWHALLSALEKKS